MRIEKDLMIPTRDGSPLCLNVFRPEGSEKVPVILCMSPYGKDTPVMYRERSYGSESATSEHACWETADPSWWVPHGYALVRVDSRGAFKSPGKRDFISRKEQEDYYDMVEWCGTQPWCNGKVGLLGISFFSSTQWPVAALNPPHLAAICPWEGYSDMYRDRARHGGMYYCFTDQWWKHHYTDQGEDEKPGFVDWRVEFRKHEWDDEFYAERRADLSKITVPVLSAGNWGALHMHLRGNVEGYLGVSSKYKYLYMFVGSHVAPFYTDWGKAEQKRFLDHFLKGVDNGYDKLAPVRLAIRHGKDIVWRDEQEWPIARTQWTKCHLDASDKSLSWKSVAKEAKVTYPMPAGGAIFHTAPVEKETEITGPVALRVWISSSTTDTDVFVALRLIDVDGKEIMAIGPRGDGAQMAIGFLRASHRELDPEKTLPYRPYHKHKRAMPLKPGEPVPMDIEVWPTSIVLKPGQRLRLDVTANDDHMAVEHYGHHDPQDKPADRFVGDVTLYAGGKYDSHLLLPIIPPR
jgi:predicted acyl esterase